MSIKGIRAKTVKSRKLELKLNADQLNTIEQNTVKAVNKIKELVEINPDKKQSFDIYLGNSTFNSELVDLYVAEYNKTIKTMGYGSELIAERSGWSNIGDPFYMGKAEDITGYKVRIKER